MRNKPLENTVGKGEIGEIARYKQLLLFPQCFQKACFSWASNDVIVREWVDVVFKIISIIVAASSPIHAFLEVFFYTFFA